MNQLIWLCMDDDDDDAAAAHYPRTFIDNSEWIIYFYVAAW